MQRYRINYPLLIGLVVGTFVLIGGAYGLYRVQKERNADRLLVKAEQTEDILERVKLLNQYTSLRPDDLDGEAKLAEAYVVLAEQPDIQRRDLGKILAGLESTVRRQPDRYSIREQLVDLLMKLGDYRSASQHLGQLLNQKPKDPELEKQRSTCLFFLNDDKASDNAFRLVGYDKETGEFDLSKAIVADEPIIYARLANRLRNDRKEEVALKVINQMVEVNPEDGAALLMRGQYIAPIDKEQRNLDYQAALAIAPDDPSIVIANSLLLFEEDKYEEAQKLVDACLEDNPGEMMLYRHKAEIERRNGNPEKALEVYDVAVKKVTNERALAEIGFERIKLLIDTKDIKQASRALKRMRSEGIIAPAYVGYLDARIAMAESKWFDAAKKFEKFKGQLSKNRVVATELNAYLALCYEKLGQFEKALDTYNVALQQKTNDPFAIAGRQRMLQQLGRTSKDSKETVQIFSLLAKEIAKPEEEQDWEEFDLLVDRFAEQRGLEDAMRIIIEAEVLMKRGKFPESRAKLIEAYKANKENLAVRRAAVKLFASDPEQGAVKALKLLDNIEKDFGDMAILRLDRADLLLAINDESINQQLFELSEDTEEFATDQQVLLWSGLAARFQRLRDRESQLICLQKVANLSPSELPTVINLLLMAASANDIQGIEDAQERILKIVGSKNDATWLFSEAHRLLTIYRNQNRDPEILDEAQTLVKRAREARPEWHKLYELQATIDLINNDGASALKNLDLASSYGRVTAASLFMHVKLLKDAGRFQDVLTELESSNPSVRMQLLGREYAESLLRVGRTAEAMATADQLASENQNNSEIQFWYGKFMQQMAIRNTEEGSERDELLAKAGKAYQKAVEQKPDSSDIWLAVVSHYVATGNAIAAEDAIRDAQINLIEDQNILLFARCYELIGRWMDAESLYKQAIEDAANKEILARSNRLIARFYLSPSYPRKDSLERAVPHINTVLRMAVEEELPNTDANVRWARSAATRMLSNTGQYQKLIDAERVLSSNASNGVLPIQDRILMAEILAPRPEPVSRLKAARLFEEVRQNQTLTLQQELTLGKVYYALGDWRKCRSQMINTLARYNDSPEARITYLEMLLERGGPNELNEAVKQLKRLQQIEPDSFRTREMIARVAIKRGRRKDAIATLGSMLPKKFDSLTPEQLNLVKQVAAMLVSFEEYKAALQLFNVAADVGGPIEKVQRSTFKGSFVDLEEGLDELSALRNEVDEYQIAKSGVICLRNQSKKSLAEPEYFEMVDSWIQRGLRDDPLNAKLLSLSAELFDIRREYPKAMEVYKKLLNDELVEGVQRAVVLNNLSYMMALSEGNDSSTSEAMEFLHEAVGILGPRSDILDTRAVISIAAQDYSSAIADLDLAVTDKPTASKYFHKAIAHFRAGQTDNAAKAWTKALDFDLKREDVSQLEKGMYDEVRQKLLELELILDE